jgi:LysR family glycine cleavage system transcriptional activator
MRLPPLNAVRVFEAAARHMSFTRAAAELRVTQTAVSHQIRHLETWLGRRLFRRMNRRLSLTEEGREYLACVRSVFDELADGTQRLLAPDGRRVLAVSVIPSLAARWLVPRLGRFREAHPNLDLRVSATPELVDIAHGDAEVGLRYGTGRYPGLHTTLLAREECFPVCSPSLLNGAAPLRSPADLWHHMLLHDEFRPGEPLPHWRDWLRAAGCSGVDAERGVRFADAGMMVQAAVAGQGVGLGRTLLVKDELAAGRLARPFELALPSGYAYWMVCTEAAAESPTVDTFRRWVLAEMAE